jgi:hypothetical protein
MVVGYPVRIPAILLLTVPLNVGPLYSLPKPLLIIGALKTEDMIRISSRGLCGEDDFGYRREKEARIPAVKKRDSVAPKEKI